MPSRFGGAHRRAAGSLAALTLAATLLVARTSLAEPTTEERAAAEALFREARELIDKGELEPACGRFAESQRLDPQVGTLLYLATCHEQIGKTATAWVEFTDALSQAQAAGKQDRVEQAQQGVARVEPLLSKMSLHVKVPTEGLKVTINGREFRTFDTSLPYDPGELVVEASAPGKKTHSQKVTVEKGPVALDVDIPELEAETTLPVPNQKVTEVDPTYAYIVGGAGLGVTALGFGFGLGAMITSSNADDDCQGTVCTQAGLDGHDTATALAWASNVTIGVGVAAVATGVILYFVGPTHEVDAPSATSWAPTLLPVVDARGKGAYLPGVSGTFQ
jgi:hypothetical protein